MPTYPFIVRKQSGRTVHRKIVSDTYNNALNKVLSINQNKFVQTKFALNMNLIETKNAAKAAAKKDNVPMFVFVANADISDCRYNANDTMDGYRTLCVFGTDGKEKKVKQPEVKQSAVQVYDGEKVTRNREAEKKSIERLGRNIPAGSAKAAKLIAEKDLKESGSEEVPKNSKNNKMKTVKKVAAKKVAKKAVKKVAGKKKDSSNWGKQVSISIADMRAGIKKGFQFRDPQGVIQSDKYMKTRANQEFVREGMWSKKLDK